MHQDDRRTTDEAYATATSSSNLRCDTREHAPINDSDVLTAAGWSPVRIGGALLRLVTEYGSAARAPGADTRTDAAMFMSRLRTLPEVRDQLALRLRVWGVEHPERAALAIIAAWLQRVCSKCGGRGFDVVPGTARLSGRACKACNGSGQERLPMGEVGRRAANFLDDAVQAARSSIRPRLHRMTGR